jgi:raffinose/stachyose/melibiose transport system permease protein
MSEGVSKMTTGLADAEVSAKRTYKKRKLQTSQSSRARYYFYVIPGLVAFAAVIGASYVRNIYLSFTKWNGLGTPKFIGLSNYKELYHDPTFWKSFIHAFVFIGSMALIPTALGLLFGAVIFDFIAPKFGNASSSFMRVGLFVPQIIPITVSGILWVWMLEPNSGAINNFLRSIGLPSLAQNWLGDSRLALLSVSIMLILIQIGYTVVIFVSGMSRIDPALHEAAQIDGASWLQRFRIITINQLRPEISVVLLTTTVAALKVFAPVYVMTQGGPGDATVVPSFFSYFHFFTTQKVGYGAAVATVLSIILSVLAIVLLRMQNRKDA